MRNAKRLLVLLFAALPMMAGNNGTVTIVYSALAATPTLSETMLIALGLLLPVLAFRSLRNVSGGRGVAAMIVAGGLLALEAVSGYHMIPTATAFVGANITLPNPAGGTISNANVPWDVTQIVQNTSGVSLLLQSVTFNTGGASIQTGQGYCVNGTVLTNSATCSLRLIGNIGF